MLSYNIERMLSASEQCFINATGMMCSKNERDENAKGVSKRVKWIGTTSDSWKSIVHKCFTLIIEFEWPERNEYWSILDISANWNEIKSKRKTSTLACIQKVFGLSAHAMDENEEEEESNLTEPMGKYMAQQPIECSQNDRNYINVCQKLHKSFISFFSHLGRALFPTQFLLCPAIVLNRMSFHACQFFFFFFFSSLFFFF